MVKRNMSKRKVHLHMCDIHRIYKFYKKYTRKAFRRKFMKNNYDIKPNSLNKEFNLSWWS